VRRGSGGGRARGLGWAAACISAGGTRRSAGEARIQWRMGAWARHGLRDPMVARVRGRRAAASRSRELSRSGGFPFVHSGGTIALRFLLRFEPSFFGDLLLGYL